MTTLKTPEELTESTKDYSQVIGWYSEPNLVEEVITQDRQHIAEVLCELLEGVAEDYADDGGVYVKLEKAQALIRQTLDPISSNER